MSFIDALRDLANAAGKAVASASAALHSAGVAPPPAPSTTGPTFMGMPAQPGATGPGVTLPPPPPQPPWVNPVQQPGQMPWAMPAGPNQPQFDWQVLLKNLGGKLEGAQKFAGDTGMGDLTKSLGLGDVGAGLGKAADLAQTGARAFAGDPTAMVKLAVEGAGAVIGQGKEAVSEAGKALGSERAGEAGGHMIRSAGAAAAALGGPVTSLLHEYLPTPDKFAAALVESVDKLRDFAQGLHAANMKFAEFSGSMAKVQADQEVRDIMLKIERGERRAPAAGRLAKAKTELEVAITPWEDKWASIKADLTTMIVKPLAEILQKVTDIVSKLGILDEGERSGEVQKWLEETGNQQLPAFNRPNRFHI